MKYLIIIGSLVLSQLVAATAINASLSARREPGRSYQFYLKKGMYPLLGRGSSAMDQAQIYENARLRAVTKWPSKEEMLSRFKEMRDERFLVDNKHPNFLRRITWLYPDDGCYARAQLAIRNLLRRFSVGNEPEKIFVFGDLNVRTNNSPNGEVSWWYHVAPIVEVDDVKYVLDPSLEPESPLLLDEWLAKQSHRPLKLEVAICNSGTYSPSDLCDQKNDGMGGDAERDEKGFLKNEWSRLVELGRNPEDELGEKPPWAY